MITIPPVYEDGVFKPLVPASLPEGALAQVILPSVAVNPLAPQQAPGSDGRRLIGPDAAREMMEAIKDPIGMGGGNSPI